MKTKSRSCEKSKSYEKIVFSIFLVFWVCLGIYILRSDWFPKLNRVNYGMVFDGYLAVCLFLAIIAGPIYEKKYPEYLKKKRKKRKRRNDTAE